MTDQIKMYNAWMIMEAYDVGFSKIQANCEQPRILELTG